MTRGAGDRRPLADRRGAISQAGCMREEWVFVVKTAVIIALLGVLALTGCTNVGAPVLVRDRFDYSVAIAESWKSQMLLNIVKIR
jgi:hypothetical protein